MVGVGGKLKISIAQICGHTDATCLSKILNKAFHYVHTKFHGCTWNSIGPNHILDPSAIDFHAQAAPDFRIGGGQRKQAPKVRSKPGYLGDRGHPLLGNFFLIAQNAAL